jgi:hypothetical protein
LLLAPLPLPPGLTLLLLELLLPLLLVPVLPVLLELTLLPPSPPQAESAIGANKQTTAAFLIWSFRGTSRVSRLSRLVFDVHQFAIKNMSPHRDGALLHIDLEMR